MFHRGILRFAFALCVVAALSAADDKVDESTTVKISPEPPQPSSSSAAPTSKPTSAVPTTPVPTTPAPTTPTPTTTKPTTTGAPPTTTKPSPTPAPTTAPPTTTTAAPTTPKPAPPPEPEEGTWAVVDASANRTCVLVHMMAVVDVYDTADNKTMVEQVNVPRTANATGTCGETTQTITLYWPYDKTKNNTVELTFKKNESNFELENVSVMITRTGDQNKSIPLVANHTKDEFITPIKMSYKCKKGQLLNLTSAGSNVTVASFHISNVQFQAFGNMTKQDFAAAKDCEPYETPDVVPIAVGCALIALIVVVLVGYLIGRRRNQARGYLSMFTQTKKEEDYIPMKNLSCFQ